MNAIPFFALCRAFRRPVCFLWPLAILLAAGATPVLVRADAAPKSISVVRAGVAYNAQAPLDAAITPKFDTTSPPSILTYAVHFKGADGEVVPGIFVTQNPKLTALAGPKPTVLLLHGLGGRKEDLYLMECAFASKGYSVLAIDAAGHGERPPIGGKAVAELDLAQMHHLCGETVVDLRRAVDWLQTRPDVDPARIGFLGISLGGIIGGVFVADEPRIHAAALWAAGGNWGKLVATSAHPFAESFRKSGFTESAKIEKVMADVDPLTTVAAIAPRPLLFLNGDKDTVVPVSCANGLYAAARDPKERVLLPGGHIPDILTMLDKSLRWMGVQLHVAPIAAAPKPAN